jgi:hypothetical protein
MDRQPRQTQADRLARSADWYPYCIFFKKTFFSVSRSVFKFVLSIFKQSTLCQR